MKRILMIGAGVGQVFLSKKIKDRGDYLIIVTLPGQQPAIEIADKVIYHDVLDKEGVLEIARNEKIDAVISDQNDNMMPTVAYVAEKMKIPGLRSNQVNAYCNKNIFRNNCDKLGIPVPRHIEVNGPQIPEEFKDIPFPWIVKPADSQSSVGVEKVQNKEEYYTAIKKAISLSKIGSAILEEFFEGREVVAEGFIYKGKYYNLGFADRKYFNLENLFIPSQTIFPSNLDKEIKDRIILYESRMANYIKPDFAIVHSEYLYNPDTDKLRVVESALRGGGVYISSHLVPMFSGIDVNDILIDCVLGKEIDIERTLSQRNEKAAAYVCFYLPEGTITDIQGIEKAKQLPFVKMMFLEDIKIGNKTSKLTHKGQRLGPIIISGEDKEDIDKNIELLQKTINITIKSNEEMNYNINWE